MFKYIVSAVGLFAFGQSALADSVSINSLNFGGSGCTRYDSRAQLYDVDRNGLPEQFEILFDNYIAQQGPGIPIAMRRRNCNISVQLHLPQGFQFSIANVQYIGYADLPRGVTGRQQSSYNFPFLSNTVTLGSTLYGPYSGGYTRQDNLGITSVVWSPCGTNAPLNIRTEVNLVGTASLPASLSTDQIDGRVRQIYGLQWRACH